MSLFLSISHSRCIVFRASYFVCSFVGYSGHWNYIQSEIRSGGHIDGIIIIIIKLKLSVPFCPSICHAGDDPEITASVRFFQLPSPKKKVGTPSSLHKNPTGKRPQRRHARCGGAISINLDCDLPAPEYASSFFYHHAWHIGSVIPSGPGTDSQRSFDIFTVMPFRPRPLMCVVLCAHSG